MTQPPARKLDDLGSLDEQLVVRPRRRPPQEVDMDITPMIDIVFLLLIFFIVTSKLSETGARDLPTAAAGGAVAGKEAVVVTLVGTGDDVVIYKGDSKDDADRLRAVDAADQEDELVAYIRDARQGPPRKQYVLVKASRGVKHGQVARVSHAIGRATEGGTLHLAVMEEQ
ncbi:MAG: biopolymer transporter ExbD [Planctomycetales bacterium]|nr:biopolymer transporter ExbD [Planctomycetales bacterium]